MFLLAQISMLGALVIAGIAGWLFLHLMRGRRGTACSGGGWKIVGIAAIAAGIGYFWMRSEPARHQPAAPKVVNFFASDDHVAESHLHRSVVAERVEVTPDRWVFVMLGSALVILGALLFGRSSTRPGAVKAVTFLGIGAIIYAVVTYVGHPPSRGPPAARSVVHVPARPEPGELGGEYAPTSRRTSRAKRPSVRPVRPTIDEADQGDTLPPRAGEIPVSAELARKEAPRDAQAAPVAASEPAKAEPAQTAETPAESPPDKASPDKTESAAPEPSPSDTKPEAPASPAPVEKPAPPAPVETPAAPVEAPTAPALPALPVAERPEVVIHIAEDEPRPEWVDAQAGLNAQGAYWMPVHSGRFTSVPECQRALELEIKRATDQYIDDYLEPGAAEIVNLPLEYIHEHIQRELYGEQVHSESVGPMYEMHAQLVFDKGAQADFHRLLRSAEVTHRLWYAGGGAALVLALLATLYGYLKLDLRTGGAHTGRLQLAATLVALIVAAGVLLVRWAVSF